MAENFVIVEVRDLKLGYLKMLIWKKVHKKKDKYTTYKR